MAKLPPDVIRLTVKVDGQMIAGTTEVVSVVTLNELDRIPYARLQINDGSPALADFLISNSQELAIGKEIEVLAGYHDEETSIFTGVILSHKIRAGSSGSQLIIEARHPAFKATLQEKEELFLVQSDSDIVETICGIYGLSADVTATSLIYPHVVQHRTTDWDFMLMRLHTNGQHIFCVDGGLVTKIPDFSLEPSLVLTYGEDILDIEMEADARSQVKGVETIAWNSATQELDSVEGVEPGLPALGDFVDSDLSAVSQVSNRRILVDGMPLEGQLQAVSDSALARSRMAKVRGRVRCQGYADIVPGQCIELAGIGTHFVGNHFVNSVRQEITSDGWTTDIQLGLDSPVVASPAIAFPADRATPVVSGLHLGTVLKITEAPDDEARVLVNLPMIYPADEGIWARMSSLDAGRADAAGKGRGIFFLPEVDDEVVLAFLGDDPCSAVILGMLHNTKLPAPIPADETNSTKGIYTRADLQLTFNDDMKIIELLTPAGNRISLDEDQEQVLIECQNANSILMNEAGITIKSCKDLIFEVPGDMAVTVDGDSSETIGGKLTVETTGDMSHTSKAKISRDATSGIDDSSTTDIKLTAMTNVDINATADVNVAGLNVNHEANAQFVAKGNAGAEVSTPAIAVLKGSLVQIN